MSRRLHPIEMTILTTLLGATWLAWSAAAYAQSNVTAEHQAVLDARKKVADAQTERGKNNARLSGVINKKRQEFNKSPEMVAALEAQKTAQTAYDAAKAKVIESLGPQPQYVSALKVRAEARQKLKKTQADNAPPDQLAAIAEACLVDEGRVDKMENEAFEADGPTKDAKAAAAKANGEVAALRKKFEEGLKTDTDYTAAKTGVDAAVTVVKTAQAELNDKIRAENVAIAAARAAQIAAQQQNNNQRRSGGGGGGRRGGGGGGGGF